MKRYLEESYPHELIGKMMVMSSVKENYLSVERLVAFRYDNLDLGYPRQKAKNEKDLEFIVKRKNPTQLHFHSLKGKSIYSEEIVTELMEIVFDIDVTDFERYCLCIQQVDKKRTCSSCWHHIVGASIVLEYILKELWGVPSENILWVLSGMKGFHCIVNEKRFLFLTKEERTSLFLQLQKTNDKQLIQFASLLSSEFSLTLQKEFLEKSIVSKSLLNSDKFQNSCLSLIKNEYYPIYNALSVKWFNQRAASSEEKWKALLDLEKGQFGTKPLPSLVIILKCYYPKIDKGPFCESNHLFKLPYSIHTTTRKISLPVEREEIKLEGIPTLSEANVYYQMKGKPLPILEESFLIFKKWVDSY